MNYFLDTNICIYYLKGMYPEIVRKLLSRNPEDIKIPSIVKAELFHGAEKSMKKEETKERINEFLMPFEVIGFNDEATEIYGMTRKNLERQGMIIGPNDLLIASIVLSAEGTLITRNTKEFERVDNLKIENWTE